MLICIGEILVDIFDDGKNKKTLPGGAPFNVACNALLYTKEVGFIGAVGDDSDGHLLINEANKRTFKLLDIKVDKNRYTSKAIVTLDNGERSFKFDRHFGADYALDINDIDLSKFKDEDIIHLGSLMLSEEMGVNFYNAIIDKIHAFCKAKISFDVNYRDDIFSSSSEAKNVYLSALRKADIVKLSIEEINLLTDEGDLIDRIKQLINDKQICVVTMGSKGSLFYQNGRYIEVPTYPVKPIDTTGAGDAFYSYFLASLVNDPKFINDEEKIKHYLKRANVVGGLTTLKMGAINSAPQEEEIDNFLLGK